MPLSPTRIAPPSDGGAFGLPSLSRPAKSSGSPSARKSGSRPPSCHVNVRPSFEVMGVGGYSITTVSAVGYWSAVASVHSQRTLVGYVSSSA